MIKVDHVPPAAGYQQMVDHLRRLVWTARSNCPRREVGGTVRPFVQAAAVFFGREVVTGWVDDAAKILAGQIVADRADGYEGEYDPVLGLIDFGTACLVRLRSMYWYSLEPDEAGGLLEDLLVCLVALVGVDRLHGWVNRFPDE